MAYTITRGYFTLLQRDDLFSPWGVQFGDYDRDVVKEEIADIRASTGARASCFKVIETTGAANEIAEVVAHLNAQVKG